MNSLMSGYFPYNHKLDKVFRSKHLSKAYNLFIQRKEEKETSQQSIKQNVVDFMGRIIFLKGKPYTMSLVNP